MDELPDNRSIHIKGDAIGSAIISGDQNTVYIVYQKEERVPATRLEASNNEVGPNPYKGLSAFQEKDAANYFGREVQIARLWKAFQRLYDQPTANKQLRFLPIVGPSGCGKSSLVRAGLIPELSKKPIYGKENLKVVVMVPGESPVRSLSGILAKLTQEDSLPEITKKQSYEAAFRASAAEEKFDYLQSVVETLSDIQTTPLVIFVDQFEEVYSLCQDSSDRHIFIENLLRASASATGYVTVVATIRSDFLSKTQQHPLLNQAIGSASYNPVVQAMHPDELRRAIAEPASRAGRPFSEALVELLIRDTYGREGALPLLQFALTRLWEGQKVKEDYIETYRKIGGVGGALAQRAQSIYESLSPTEQDVAQRMFVGLVQPGEGRTQNTRKRVTIEELLSGTATKKTLSSVIECFASQNARLLSLSIEGDRETVEITHEALLEHWQLLREWLLQDRDKLRFRERLIEAATDWQRQGQPDGLVWRSPNLDLLRTFDKTYPNEIPEIAKPFFVASNRADRHRKLIRLLSILGLTFTTVVIAGLGLFNHRSARRQMALYEANASDNESIERVVSGLAAIGLGRSWFVKMPRPSDADLVSTALLDLPNRALQFEHVFAHTHEVTAVAMSADGQVVVSGDRSGTIRLWRPTGELIGKPLKAHTEAITAVAISTDGQSVASGSEDSTVRLWTTAGKLVREFVGHDDWVTSVAMSADGQAIVSGSEDGTVRLWTIEGTSTKEPFRGHRDPVYAVDISADGQTIVSGGWDKTIRIWNQAGSEIEKFEGHEEAVAAVAVSADGETIVSGDWQGVVQLRTRENDLVKTVTTHNESSVTAVGLSKDKQTIISSDSNGNILLQAASGNPVDRLSNTHSGDVRAVAISADGRTFISGGDRTVKQWRQDRYGSRELLRTEREWILPVAISASGKQAVVGDGRSVHVWTPGSEESQRFAKHTRLTRAVATSADGQTIISVGDDRKIKVWTPEGEDLLTLSEDYFSRAQAVVTSADGQTIAAGGEDWTISLWDLSSDSPIEPLARQLGWVTSLSMSADGRVLASGHARGARLWRREGDQFVEIAETPLGATYDRNNTVRSIAISADGQTVVSGGWDERVRLWTQTGEAIGAPFEGHSDEVHAVAISADGQRFASGGDDGTLRLWTRSGAVKGEPFEGHQGRVSSVAMSADGQTVLTSGEDGTVRLWPVNWSESGWLSYSCNRIRGYLVVRKEVDESSRIAYRTCDRYVW